ncbi:MAG: cobyrinate a,c-diamide synthase [Lachnospiraceae bacterium]|nr:cobyrinate a,c-diamide synthase [Lachnospiraceae bacterium]
MKIPRVLLAAPKSGSGKTLITCALLGALKKKGFRPAAFKCGPDYIDPMFHRTVLKVPSENLDTFFSGEDTKRLFAEAAKDADIAVMEGVMGLFDGLGGTREEGSAYHLAKMTKTPIILVVDVHGMGLSMVPLIKGFLDYDTEGLIRGVILNRMTASFLETMRPMLEKELSVPVIGFFPSRKDIHLESRHLGLMLPGEIEDLETQLDAAADQFLETAGFDRLLQIADAAEDVEDVLSETYDDANAELTLAVARDEAFCFYYGANMRTFQKKGVKIRYFSPLHDTVLPEDADGILLGGGYPELYVKKLGANESMKASIREAIGKGIPSLAECGGFLYLHEFLEDTDGNSAPMVGLIKGTAGNTGKLVRFGYVELSEKSPCFLKEGSKIKAHEFHYYDSPDNGDACVAVKPVTGKTWECIHEGNDHFWGFPHLYYPSCEEFADHFVEAMRLHKASAEE